jgi:hypothetical protein
VTAEYARTEWDRALEAFRGAQLLVAHGGFDSAASRAYYAAFHAVNRADLPAWLLPPRLLHLSVLLDRAPDFL